MAAAMRSNFLACGSILSRRWIITIINPTTYLLSAKSALHTKLQLQLPLHSSFHHWPGLPTPQIFDDHHLQHSQEPPTTTTSTSSSPSTTPTTTNKNSTAITITSKKPTTSSKTNDMFSTWIGDDGTRRKHASFGISQYAASGFAVVGCCCSVVKFFMYGQ